MSFKILVIDFLVAKDKISFSDTYVPSQLECEVKVILQLHYKIIECVSSFEIL
jgi:hypothetical protein